MAERAKAEYGYVVSKAQMEKLCSHYAATPCMLKLEIAPDMALKQVPLLWEAVSEEANNFGLVNPEILLHKEQAFRFVEPRVHELLRLRHGAVKEAAEIRGLIERLDQDLERGSPAQPPAGFQAWRLNGPHLFYHREMFDAGVNWEVNSQAHTAQPALPHDDIYSNILYWSAEEAWKREVKALEACKKFNRTYLEAKLEALQAFTNKITEGADRLLTEFLRAQSYLGAAPTDFNREFINKEISISEKDLKAAAMPIELCYGGDGDDTNPSSDKDLKEVEDSDDGSDSSDGIPETDDYL